MKNWCFWIVVLEKMLESPWDSREIKPINPKGNQPWIFIGRTDAEAEAPILWPPDAKSLLTGKDPDAGKDWGQEEKRTKENKMVGWHHWLNEHEFEQALGDGQGQKAWCAAVTGSQRVGHDWVTEQQQQIPHNFILKTGFASNESRCWFLRCLLSTLSFHQILTKFLSSAQNYLSYCKHLVTKVHLLIFSIYIPMKTLRKTKFGTIQKLKIK